MRILAAIVALCAAMIVIKDARHWRTGDPRHASFRTVVISVLILLGLSVGASARPSPYPPVTQFNGDRYAGHVVATKPEKAAHFAHKRAPVARKTRTRVPVPKPRRVTDGHHRADTGLSLGGGIGREVGRAAGRPAAWCGWWLGHHLGMPLRELWLARNWAKVGTDAGGPQVGAVVVWIHHVGIITGRSDKGWIVKSGNDGRAVRERVRSVAGAIAFRKV